MAEKKHTQDPLDLEEAVSASEAFIIKYKEIAEYLEIK